MATSFRSFRPQLKCHLQVRLQDLANKNTGCLIKFEFQTSNAIIHFSINMSHVIFGTYCKEILEKAVTPHSSTLAWKIPWMEEPGMLQSMGSLQVRYD